MPFSNFEIQNITDKKLREKLAGRGSGSILFTKPFNSIEAYYIYYFNKKEVRIKIGIVKHNNEIGLTISKIRNEASKLAVLKKEHSNLKYYLWLQEQEQKIEEQKQIQIAEKKAATGTFEDLTKCYVQNMKSQDKISYKDAERYFRKDVFYYFPELKKIKASDVKTEDIVKILAFHIHRGITTATNRLRSYLLAAFNYGLRIDNDPRHVSQNEKRFYLSHNPVATIPKQSDYERVSNRVLSRKEVNHLWNNIDKTEGINPVIVSLIKFLFTTGGQRPKQLLRANWEQYNYRRKTLNIIDKKGKSRCIEYLTPLTSNSLAILSDLSTHNCNYPFTTNGEIPICVETILTSVNTYCEQFNVTKFTTKDIRRTCKNLMIDAGVNRETRNLIQNHGLTGIDFKHYDKHDHLPEKTKGLKKYNKLLKKIIQM